MAFPPLLRPALLPPRLPPSAFVSIKGILNAFPIALLRLIFKMFNFNGANVQFLTLFVNGNPKNAAI